MRAPVEIKGVSDAQCWCGYVATSGESPIWCAESETILWVDIRGGAVLEGRWDDGSIRVLPVPDLPAFVAPMRDGGLLVAGAKGLVRVDRESGAIKPLSTAGGDLDPNFRFNDGAIDPQGRLVIGSTALEPGASVDGTLYVFEAVDRRRALFHGLGIVNGIAFSPGGETLMVSDSKAGRTRVFQFDYDPLTAQASGCRMVADFAANGWLGVPDGAAFDSEGGYWIAALGGAAVLRLRPDGTLDRRVDLPFAKVSKLAFVGPRLDRMAVTSFADPGSAGPFRSGMLLTFDTGFGGAPNNCLAF